MPEPRGGKRSPAPSSRVLVTTGDGSETVDASELSEQLAGRTDVEAVPPEDVANALRHETVDCLAIDANVDGSLANRLDAVREHAPDLPVVLYGDGDPLDPAVVSAGVDDYVEVRAANAPDALADAVLAAIDDGTASKGPHALDAALIQNSSDVLAILNRDGTIEYMSPAVERVVGWTPEELEGELAIDYIHPDDHETVAVDFFGDPAEWVGEQHTATFRLRDDDGEWHIVESTARSRLDDPVVDGVVMNSRDVTEREARKEELELYETIVETIPVGLFVIDEESSIEWANREALNIVDDKTHDELLDIRILDLIREGYFDHELATKYVDGVRDMLSSDTDADRLIEDIAFYPREGDTRYLNVHWALRPLDDGEFRGTVVVFQEITERKQFEEQLKEKNERLEQFASFVSHDLRNPLNVAQGFTTQARETGDPGAIEEIEVSLNRMEQLIEELLTMAREGRELDEVADVDLRGIAETAWRTVDTKDATLSVVDEAVVRADASLIRQAFENLIRNAVEHAGADVAVTVGTTDDGFYLADDGPGIPEDRRDEVLEMGYTTSQEGTGFGLGIVAQIADAHDWDVAVTEGEDGGARFEFSGVELSR